MVSKINTALQLVLVTAVLAQRAFGIADHGLLTVLVYLVGATTIASGGAYLVRWTRGVTNQEHEA
jgi:hypothetical protein